MKSLALIAAPVVRLIAILVLLGNIAAPVAQAQVSFLQPLTFPGTTSEVTADFNRDGNLDIATPGTLLLGNGNGTFKAPINLSVSGNLVATADFNGDGTPDLLIASTQSTTLNILLGNGDGMFQPAKSTNVGISFSSIAVADVNGDGKPDILGLAGTQVFVFLGNGNGTFAAGVPYSAGPNPYLMLTGDFNGDGKVDIATADGYPGQIAVMLGNGNGTFQSPVISTGATQPFDMAAADVNNDGKVDLIIADQSTSQTFTFLGNGDGTFQAGIVAAPAVGSVGIADVNGDGKPDLILNPQFPSVAEILLGNGDGTFTYFRAYSSQFGGDDSSDILVAEFTNSGNLDVAISGTMLLGNGNGTFNGQPVTVLAPASSAAAGDFNGDGDPDLGVTSSSNVDIVLGDGTGSFTVAHTYTLTAPGTAIAAGDLTDDGKLDLAILTIDAAQDWSLAVTLGNGDGTFGTPTVYQQGQATSSSPVLIADLRGDHKPDVLTVQGDSLVVFPNNGDGTFGAPVSYFAGSAANGAVVADFNNDGKLDAATSSSAGIGVLLGNGDGTFQGATFFATPGNAGGIVTGDFNNDGKSDLIVSGNGGPWVFLGNGNGTFTTLPETLAAGVVSVADFNGDGNLDLVEGGCPFSTAQFTIWCVQLGNGDGTFGNPTTIMTGSDVISGFLTVADFNRDQKPDVAIDLSPSLNPSPGGVFVLLNTTPPAPGATVSPSALTFPSQVAGTSSTPLGVAVSNHGKGVLTVSGIKFTGTDASEFSQTNNCTTVQPGASCTIKVVFAPTAAGSALASLGVTDNAVGSPQTVALSGTATAAPDFAIDPAKGSSNSATITAGQTASFNLSVTPAGSFSGMVSLSCAITPAVAPAPVCALPASVNVPPGMIAPLAVKVSTTAPVTAGSISSANFPTGGMPISWTMVLLASGLLFAGYRRRTRFLAVPVIALAFLAMPGCGGGGSPPPTTTPGTPAGTYKATVTAKSGSLSHNTTLTMIVQ